MGMFDPAATEREFLTGTWKNTFWAGVPIYKFPTDLHVYHQLIWQQRPELIIETGTALGGSASFFADQQQLRGIDRNVITIDIEKHVRWKEPGVEYLLGDSLKQVDRLRRAAANYQSILISLDSNHTYRQVRAELEAYAPLVPVGSCLVVEDTFLGYMTTDEARQPFFGSDNPLHAVGEFLTSPLGAGFRQIKECDQFAISMNPGGWLRRDHV